MCIAMALVGSSGCGKSTANLGQRLDAGADESDLDSGRLGLGDARVDGSNTDASGTGISDADVVAPPMANVEWTFSGCAPTFDAELVVLQSTTSVSMSSRSGRHVTGSIDLKLDGHVGELALSTRHRLDTGVIVNLIINTLEASGTWTNISTEPAVLAGLVPDPIGGTLHVNAYDRASATMDLTFNGVTLQLQNAEGTVCRIDGRLRTFGPSFE